jgi:hypothetical protein
MRSDCSYLWEGSCLIYVICVCLRIVVSTHIVLWVFSACVPNVASFSGLSMFSIVFVVKTCVQTMKHNLNEKKKMTME